MKKEIIFHCLFHTVFRAIEFSFFEMIRIMWKKYGSITSLFPSWEELISLPKTDCLGQKNEVIIFSHIDSIGIVKRNFKCKIICLPIYLNTRHYHHLFLLGLTFYIKVNRPNCTQQYYSPFYGLNSTETASDVVSGEVIPFYKNVSQIHRVAPWVGNSSMLLELKCEN